MSPKEDAQHALFTAIAKAVGDLEELGYDPTVRAEALESLALAYRYAAGGAQPGASAIPS